jgi:Coenzyme PQQ synthesis protein D (PqqD)
METFQTNPEVIHETIEGETIIIDLSSGTYYSLRGSAPSIWNAIADGADSGSIVRRLEGVYEAPAGEVAEAVESFLRTLEESGLIAPGESGAPAPETDVTATRVPFERPQLEKYEDLQDIILLDPVHKVDDRGWPHAAPVGDESA